MLPLSRLYNPATLRGAVLPRSTMKLKKCIRVLRLGLYWAIYLPIAPALFVLCAIEEFAAKVILPKEDRFTETDEGY
jgi:hypothetical protein